MSGVGLLGVVIVGLLAGWIAKRVLNRRQGLFANLLLGVAGALLGFWIARALEMEFVGLLGGLVVATVGSIILLAVVSILRGGR